MCWPWSSLHHPLTLKPPDSTTRNAPALTTTNIPKCTAAGGCPSTASNPSTLQYTHNPGTCNTKCPHHPCCSLSNPEDPYKYTITVSLRLSNLRCTMLHGCHQQQGSSHQGSGPCRTGPVARVPDGPSPTPSEKGDWGTAKRVGMGQWT